MPTLDIHHGPEPWTWIVSHEQITHQGEPIIFEAHEGWEERASKCRQLGLFVWQMVQWLMPCQQTSTVLKLTISNGEIKLETNQAFRQLIFTAFEKAQRSVCPQGSLVGDANRPRL